MMAFQDVHVHRKWAFADVTEDLEVERLSWIIWVDPINHMDPVRGRQMGHIVRESINLDRTLS